MRKEKRQRKNSTTHCTGRAAAMHIEKEMPDKFLLNMSGTRMTFSG